MSAPGVQGIKWRQAVAELRSAMFRPRLSGSVTSRGPGGAQQGYHPAAMRGISVPQVPAKEPVEHVYPAMDRRRGTIIDPDTHANFEGFTPPESADVLYFGGDADLSPAARRFQIGRHTQEAITANATHKSYGSSAQRSGPEGTLVMYPPRLPRSQGTRRAVSNNTMNRTPVERVGTPQINVVQAAGQFP